MTEKEKFRRQVGLKIVHWLCAFCRKVRNQGGNGIDCGKDGWYCYECIKKIHKVADRTSQLRDRPVKQILQEMDSTP